MGLLMMASMLPVVVLGPIAGTVADHFSRRKIIILSDILCGVPVLILAFLVYRSQVASDFLIVCFFLVALALGVVRSFFNPAIAAAIPDIVPEEKVSAANSLNQSSYQVSMLVGQALGGFLFVLLGAPLLFLIDGITYLFSAFSESFIRIPQRLPEKVESFREKFYQFKADTIEGFKYAWEHAGMRALFFAAAFLNFFSIPIIVLLPFYVEDYLHKTPDWYGYLLAAFGFGSLLGYAVAGIIKLSGRSRSRAMIIALILMSSCLPTFSIIASAFHALLLMALLGILNGFLNINIITILQLSISSDIRGRMFGLLTTLTGGLTPLSMGLSGIVADLLNQNIPLIYAMCGFMTLLLSILTSLSLSFRRFLQFETQNMNSDKPD